MRGTAAIGAAPDVSLRRRVAARALDIALLGVMALLAGRPSGFGIPWFAATLVGVVAYFVACDVAVGATVGKRVLDLRVVDHATGRRPTAAAALKREAFVAVGAIPFVGPILALLVWASLVLSIRRSAGGRGWHDVVAGTSVLAQGSSR